MGDPVKIMIAEEFSQYPVGRDSGDSTVNGEKSRTELLFPRYSEAKERDVPLEVSLAGVMSFGSSFLEEAFGGLIRKCGVDRRDLKRRLVINIGRPGDIRYKDAIIRYIDRAKG